MCSSSILTKFDEALSAQCLTLEATVIGGAAMVLPGITSRQTRDVDILNPELEAPIKQASTRAKSHNKSAASMAPPGTPCRDFALWTSIETAP